MAGGDVGPGGPQAQPGGTPTAGATAVERLIGREREIQAIRRALSSVEATSVAIVGRRGIGKSLLAGAAGEIARASGWRLLPAAGPLEVRHSEAVDDVLAMLDRTLKAELSEGDSQQLAADVGGTGSTSQSSATAAVTSLFTSGKHGPAGYEHVELDRVDMLRMLAPALITFDAPRVAPDLLNWMRDEAIPALRESQVRVVAITMTEPWRDVDLAAYVDVVVELSALDADAVRERFRQVAPQLPDEELAGYARAVEADPPLVESFLRLLPLTAQSMGSGGKRV
jgi:hypothetical protein